jgi:CHAT domain-containing protein
MNIRSTLKNTAALCAILVLAALASGCVQEKKSINISDAKTISTNVIKKTEKISYIRNRDIGYFIKNLEELENSEFNNLLRKRASEKIDKDSSISLIMKRAMALRDMGYIREAEKDFDLAVVKANESGKNSYPDVFFHAATNKFELANIHQSKLLFEQSLTAARSGKRGWAMPNLMYKAIFHSINGEFQEAEKTINKMDRLADEALNWRGGAPVQLYRSHTLMAEYFLEYYRGNYEVALDKIKNSLEYAYKDLGSSSEGSEQFYDRYQGIIKKRWSLVRSLVKLNKLNDAEIEAAEILKESAKYYGKDSNLFARSSAIFAVVLSAQGREEQAITVLENANSKNIKNSSDNKTLGLFLNAAYQASSFVRIGDFKKSHEKYNYLENILVNSDEYQKYIFGDNILYAVSLFKNGDLNKYVDTLEKIKKHKLSGNIQKNILKYQTFLMEKIANKNNLEVGELQGIKEALREIYNISRRVDSGENTSDEFFVNKFISEEFLRIYSERNFYKVRKKDTDLETFRLGEHLRAGSVQQALASSGARAAVNDPELADLIRREQDALSKIGALNRILVDALSRPDSQQNKAAQEQLKVDIDSLRGARAAFREEIERRFPDYADLIDPRAPDASKVAQSLRPGELLISTYVADDQTYVWAVKPNGDTRFYAVPFTKGQLQVAVGQLRRSLDPSAETLGDIPAFDVGLAYKLYSSLLAPALEGAGDVSDLLVIPHGPLGEIPFTLLVTEPHTLKVEVEGGALFSNYKDVPFLVRKYSLTQLPSAASLMALRRLPEAPETRQAFVGFGDPWFNTEQALEAKREALQQVASAQGKTNAAETVVAMRNVPLRRRSAPATRTLESAEIDILPRLPDTAGELQSIALALQASPSADVFLGDRANEQNVKSLDLADRKVIMFATHGLVPGDLNGLLQPALALSAPAVTGQSDDDGLLTVDEIIGLKLNADWVVLSACNTAAAEGAGAEAISGLGRAFFYAGTRALLVTNWPVETTSAKMLTTALFEKQSKDAKLSRAQALRAAMLKLIDGPGYVDPATDRVFFSYAHPIFWAPFSIVGDGA